ncbi:MAG: hypothetical protein CMC74_08145 [Flavobacteriaceae bacterium]|nr:hypothetical protein [Flavobacteriaceae bacterium]|tara:strand:- start:19259 stop:19498 length:240 start_codon:yes stop_codon:yes gene_type:complete
MNKVKMIWDFRGPNAHPIATHHAKHLEEYAIAENLPDWDIGVSLVSEMHSIAYFIVPEALVPELRTALKPNRGQRYQED